MSGMGKPAGDQQTWVYRTGADQWEAGATAGGSGSVSSGSGEVSASYVVLSATSSLANERVLTAGYGIAIQDSGSGDKVII